MGIPVHMEKPCKCLGFQFWGQSLGHPSLGTRQMSEEGCRWSQPPAIAVFPSWGPRRHGVETGHPHCASSEFLAHRRVKWLLLSYSTKFGVVRYIAIDNWNITSNLSKPKILTSDTFTWARHEVRRHKAHALLTSCLVRDWWSQQKHCTWQGAPT